jgi:large subunit ribosomal protein L23
MDFSRIILKPLQTEKTHVLQALETKKYCFIVEPKATKNDILIAFQAIYGVVPMKISTQLRKPAQVRTGTLKPGYSKLTKIAIVTLAKGVDIVNTKEEVKSEKKSAKKEKTTKTEVTKKEITKKEVK